MKKINQSVLLAGACLVGWAVAASATPYVPVTLTNTTSVESYLANSPASTASSHQQRLLSGGAYWGTNIGAPVYQTPQATISFVGDTVNIAFQTGMYTGVDNALAPTDVYAADVFLNALNAGVKNANGPLPGNSGSSFYNYGISLGFDSADCGTGANSGSCGAKAPGLYTIPAGVTATNGAEGNYLTSQDVWGGRNGFYYGGQYGTAACDATKAAADTSNCGGTTSSVSAVDRPDETNANLVAGITVGVGCYDGTGLTANGDPLAANKVACGTNPDGNQGILDVSLTANDTGAGPRRRPPAQLESIFANFDLFWGMGDLLQCRRSGAISPA